MSDTSQAEYQALRDTIRERGTARLCAVLGGLTAWGALAIALLITELEGGVTLVPFLVLYATFEINFLIHTGVEQIGRYGLDPLFSILFGAATTLNFFISVVTAQRRPGWIALSFIAHLAFGYRIVSAKKLAAAQRALDLDRFRSLLSK